MLTVVKLNRLTLLDSISRTHVGNQAGGRKDHEIYIIIVYLRINDNIGGIDLDFMEESSSSDYFSTDNFSGSNFAQRHIHRRTLRRRF